MSKEEYVPKTRLGLMGIDLVKCRIRNFFKAAESIENEFNLFLTTKWFNNSSISFLWVTLALRYGLKNDEKPHYGRISKKHHDLPLAIEFNAHELLWADKHGADALALLFKIEVLKALIHAGVKYKLPVEELEVELVNRKSELMGTEWWRVYLEAE